MDNIGVSDTIAYKIVDQIMSHVYPDESMSESDFLKIYNGYMQYGGTWQSLIQGDPESFTTIMKIIKAFVKIRNHPKKYGLK